MTQAHRQPPKPASWSAPPGVCRLCGKEAQGKSRTWHEECRQVWRIASDPKAARSAVYARDHGRCARCRKVSKSWDVDHALPLRMAEPGLRAWRLENLETLCSDCHGLKTVDENKRRAKEMRQRKKFGDLRNRVNVFR